MNLSYSQIWLLWYQMKGFFFISSKCILLYLTMQLHPFHELHLNAFYNTIHMIITKFFHFSHESRRHNNVHNFFWDILCITIYQHNNETLSLQSHYIKGYERIFHPRKHITQRNILFSSSIQRKNPCFFLDRKSTKPAKNFTQEPWRLTSHPRILWIHPLS